MTPLWVFDWDLCHVEPSYMIHSYLMELFILWGIVDWWNCGWWCLSEVCHCIGFTRHLVSIALTVIDRNLWSCVHGIHEWVVQELAWDFSTASTKCKTCNKSKVTGEAIVSMQHLIVVGYWRLLNFLNKKVCSCIIFDLIAAHCLFTLWAAL
jgi:hypothetical protein